MTQHLQRQAQTIYNAITQHQNKNRENTPILIAIDGRCASGKTTLAAMVQKLYGSKYCDVLHTDDFFLRPHQRTRRRLLQPGGNIDLERFWNEVLRFAIDGKPFTYRSYDCKSNQFRPERLIRPKDIILVEGAYSCHPKLWDNYQLHIFLTVSPEQQRQRIRARNGEDALQLFVDKWVPLEEQYFHSFNIPQTCEMLLDTTEHGIY